MSALWHLQLSAFAPEVKGLNSTCAMSAVSSESCCHRSSPAWHPRQPAANCKAHDQGVSSAVLLQVATLVKADWLFLLTDVDGLYTANPATHPEAVRIPEVHDITKLQVRPKV